MEYYHTFSFYDRVNTSVCICDVLEFMPGSIPDVLHMPGVFE
jgi:hypothetical protein